MSSDTTNKTDNVEHEQVSVSDVVHAYYGDLSDKQAKVFKKALFLSKGKTNNRVAIVLARIGATPTYIANHAQGYNGSKQLGNSRELVVMDMIEDELRKVTPNYWDTVGGRTLKGQCKNMLDSLQINTSKYLPTWAVNLPYYEFEDKLRDVVIDRVVYKPLANRLFGYGMSSVVSTATKLVSLFTNNRGLSLARVPRVHTDILVARQLKGLEEAHIGESSLMNIIRRTLYWDDENLDNRYKEHRDQEIDALTRIEGLTDAVIECLFVDGHDMICAEQYGLAKKRAGEYVYTDSPTPHRKFTQTFGFLRELMDTFYKLCDKLGITVVKTENGRALTRGRTYGFIKRLIKECEKFDKLVKAGLSRQEAREQIVNNINNTLLEKDLGVYTLAGWE